MSRNTLRFAVIILSVAACGSAGTGRTEATALNRNMVLIGDDGTVVVKGFGDLFGGSTVCVLPPGPARTLADQATKAAVSGGYGNVNVGGNFENQVNRRIDKIYDMTKEMIYIQQVYANACVMFGNGLFGPTCITKEIKRAGKTKTECTSGVPPETMEKYQEFLDHSIGLMAATANMSMAVVARCGDAMVSNGEECDDGNATSNDGCDAACKRETPGTPSCGDKKVDEGEECDDGNVTPNDGCNALCKKEEVKNKVKKP